ncbi:hypothetical protein 010DV004_98 [Bacillus phage 010DV004]|nr:hypothetical protein 010DV004_98 [Bacillus phage 010DV004]QZA69315.1 hypothetical protein 010DV005_98 [Bacillus phage 010DV005]
MEDFSITLFMIVCTPLGWAGMFILGLSASFVIKAWRGVKK